MSLHAGENFDKSEYGFHTSYGDYEYFYDYLGDGDFGVVGKTSLNSIQKDVEYETNTDKSSKDADRNDASWESLRRGIKGNNGVSLLGRGFVSVDGLGNETMEGNQNNKPEENNQERDISSEADTYFKTGADGTNRPRYEKRYSLKKATENLQNQEYLATVKQLGETDELRNILQTAIKNNTLGKAPNGEQSNLEPTQWLMVRTKQFKDWFGDWEKYINANILKQ